MIVILFLAEKSVLLPRILEYCNNMSYRPHNPGHDYYDKGIYLITLVVGDRDRLFGELNMDARNPGVRLTALGELLHAQWEKTPSLQLKHGNKVKLHCQAVMPDHWHGVIEVEERMSWSLGDVIQAVKAAMTNRWRKLTGYQETPISAERIRHMNHAQRSAYYATRPRHERPLFDDNYDDTICLTNPDGSYDQRHLSAMIHYVDDNPRRAIIIRLNPHFMQKCLHIVIDGRDYAAFGNLFLLRWARKVQVFCHRKARYAMLTEEERQKYGYANADYSPDYITRIPYEQTAAYRHDCRQWKAQIMQGATVIVTPGISKGERLIKDRCIESGYPLIHIQKEPIGRYWKPEASRFAACEKGMLLILAPWQPETIGDVNGVPMNTDYSIFHNLNKVAEEICRFVGNAVVKRG